MAIRVAVAGATGWAGRAMVEGILAADDLTLSAAISRSAAGKDVGTHLGLPVMGLTMSGTVADALAAVPTDVLIDYTHPSAVRAHILTAVDRGVAVVVGTSGLSADDYTEVDRQARTHNVGVIAAGNFSLTAALAKHFSLMAARYIPTWELVEYGSFDKVDAPSGTVRELAEALGEIRAPRVGVAREDTLGVPETRGGAIAGTSVHVVRLPGYVLSFESHFGLPDERLIVRHEAGNRPEPYVAGTLLAVRRVMACVGLVRGLDRLLFES